MSSHRSQPADADPQATTRQWLRNWTHVGPLLDAERWTRLEALTARQRADMTLDLLGLWQPDRSGDDADGLIRVQRTFALWRKKHG